MVHGLCDPPERGVGDPPHLHDALVSAREAQRPAVRHRHRLDGPLVSNIVVDCTSLRDVPQKELAARRPGHEGVQSLGVPSKTIDAVGVSRERGDEGFCENPLQLGRVQGSGVLHRALEGMQFRVQVPPHLLEVALPLEPRLPLFYPIYHLHLHGGALSRPHRAPPGAAAAAHLQPGSSRTRARDLVINKSRPMAGEWAKGR